MHSCPSRGAVIPPKLKRQLLVLMLLPALLLSLVASYGPVSAQEKEPSPIDVELVVPERAGPGTAIQVLIKYDLVDPNANADLNYNVFGPSRVLTRDPEPPNPAYNTWLPTEETAQGTIEIRLQVDEGSEGQTIRHLVEVRWGIKAVQFQAQTLVERIPPTPTPRPRPRPPAATTEPTPTPTTEPEPTEAEIVLRDVSLTDLNGEPLSTAEVNQEIALGATYASARDAEQVTVVIQFEPDVVNLDLPREEEGYVRVLPTLDSASEGAPLFVPPLRGRIRAYEGGGDSYTLRAIVRVVPSGEGDSSAGDATLEVISAPVAISQDLSLQLSLRTEVQSARAGESFIVHALVENRGGTSANQVQLELLGLPAGFVASPSEQTIEQVTANGGSESRVFTLRSPEKYQGRADIRLVAKMDETTFESQPLTLLVNAPKPLQLEISPSATTVYAGDTVYVDASATNDSQFEASGVTAKLIDVSGNLGVLIQDVGDIPAGESREWVFVVQVPEEFPIDTEASLVLQTLSEEGITSQSSEIKLNVVCKPKLETHVEPPMGRLRGGDSVEVIALVKNTGQCAARDVSISLVGLPESFVQPPVQEVSLAPDQVRYVTFNVLVPQGYRGDAPLIVEASTEQGASSQSLPIAVTVGGPSPVITILFGLLILVVAVTGIAGMVLYFRHR